MRRTIARWSGFLPAGLSQTESRAGFSGNRINSWSVGLYGVVRKDGFGQVQTKFIEGTPEYYRERAAEMLKKAQEAGTDEAKTVFRTLAESWDRMAQQVERPNW